MSKNIPTNLITGFLGTGKTTTVLNLLKQKPVDQKWAVLVNEFGEVGIDGAVIRSQGGVVREVPGGCMCCVAGLPMQVALNQLIRRERPERILIEPSGLGHPAQILSMLQGEQYRSLLDVRATLTLVDPRKLTDPRYTDNISFRDQLNLADVLVGNKADLGSDTDYQQFLKWADSFDPPKAAFGLVSHGQIPLEWLDCPLMPKRMAEDANAHAMMKSPPLPFLSLSGEEEHIAPLDWRRVEGKGKGRPPESCGWVFGEELVFRHDELYSFFCELDLDRVKGILRTDRGWQIYNLAGGVVSYAGTDASEDSRLEAIALSRNADWDQVERALLNSMMNDIRG